jgi:hypothetical protein
MRGQDTAQVRSSINSTRWMADGRILLAPIEYDDIVVRSPDGLWRIRVARSSSGSGGSPHGHE